MSAKKLSKINKLLMNWPKGTVAVSPWLSQQDISRNLINAYKEHGWVKSIGQGAFIRNGDDVRWPGGLYALQNGLNLQVHIGAKTCIELKGFQHFVRLDKNRTEFLFGKELKLPLWFKQCSWGARVEYYNTKCFPYHLAEAFDEHDFGNFKIKCSSLPMAMMEVCYLVGIKETFYSAAMLMDGLATLRPDVVEILLSHCSSVKVNRLFMHLAEHCDHPWVKRVNLKKVDFGSGKRVIDGGGKFISKYNISVPELKNNG